MATWSSLMIFPDVGSFLGGVLLYISTPLIPCRIVFNTCCFKELGISCKLSHSIILIVSSKYRDIIYSYQNCKFLHRAIHDEFIFCSRALTWGVLFYRFYYRQFWVKNSFHSHTLWVWIHFLGSILFLYEWCRHLIISLYFLYLHRG